MHLSIVIPTYKRNIDLKECLKSISKHSVYDNEIIILSPSIDIELKKIVIEYGALLIQDGSREGDNRKVSLWNIINRGIEIADSDYVVWLNDDCLVLPDWDRLALGYFTDEVGLVVLKASGIDNEPSFRTIESLYKIPCANYGVLKKSTGVRFDEKYSWFHGDSDISLQFYKDTDYRVVATEEGLVIHNHKLDIYRLQNENDARVYLDKEYFNKKWANTKYYKGKIVLMSRVEIFINILLSNVKYCLRMLYRAILH